jgi:hypothetical protein
VQFSDKETSRNESLIFLPFNFQMKKKPSKEEGILEETKKISRE